MAEVQVRVAAELAKHIISALRGDICYGASMLPFPPAKPASRRTASNTCLPPLIDWSKRKETNDEYNRYDETPFSVIRNVFHP